jgi:transmembrane sensor
MSDNPIEIEAGEWLARLDGSAASDAELAAFERWKAGDPRHAAAYARLAATWQALDRVRAVRPGADAPIDIDYLSGALSRPPSEAIQSTVTGTRLDPHQHTAKHSSQPVSKRPRPWLLPAAAASLLVVFTGLWVVHSVGRPTTFSTGVGGFQRVVLEDQSAIELNTDSEVRVAFTARLRKVELVRGEASFDVAHDTSRPFIVAAGDTAVRAVGTKFDVRRLDGAVEVTVDEGKVAVGDLSLLEHKADLPAMDIPQLTAGQSALANADGVKLKELPKREMARKLAWQNQMLVFDGDTLSDVVAQFNRYNSRQLVIADPNLATLQIGGYFRPTNLDAFINVLQSDFDIRVSPEGSRLLLATASPK